MFDVAANRAVVRDSARVSMRNAGLLAILLGVFFVWGVGFAAPSIVHNATHDTRHALVFPCH